MTLAKQLPSHSDQLIRILDPVLTAYKDICMDAYRSIVKPENTDGNSRGIISANWVRDEDIERLLKSLPNWIKLQKIENRSRSISVDESPEDLRVQNTKESDLLFTIYGGKTIQANEIIGDLKCLEQLAHLHESLVNTNQLFMFLIKMFNLIILLILFFRNGLPKHFRQLLIFLKKIPKIQNY